MLPGMGSVGYPFPSVFGGSPNSVSRGRFSATDMSFSSKIHPYSEFCIGFRQNPLSIFRSSNDHLM